MKKQTENLGTLTEQELTKILISDYGTLLDKGEATQEKNIYILS